MRRIALLLASITLAVMGSAGNAHAAVGVEAAFPGSSLLGYGTPLLVSEPGGSITFVNGDNLANGHDVVAFGVFGSDDQAWCEPELVGPGKCPLFWSRLIPFGESTPVLGLDRVQSGKAYPFYCTIHPRDMRGTLIVP